MVANKASISSKTGTGVPINVLHTNKIDQVQVFDIIRSNSNMYKAVITIILNFFSWRGHNTPLRNIIRLSAEINSFSTGMAKPRNSTQPRFDVESIIFCHNYFLSWNVKGQSS